MRKTLIVLLAFLAFGVRVKADTTPTTYTITLNAITSSSPAPVPTFSLGTIDTQFEQFDGEFLDFTFRPDTGAPIAPEAIPNFGVADTGPIYFCEGCAIITNSAGTIAIGATPNGAAGTVEFFMPANMPSGSPSELGIMFAFPPTPDYYVFGTLTFVAVPEPGSLLLSGVGLSMLFLLRRHRSILAHRQ